MKIVALDLGKFNSTMCRYDSKTRKASFMTVATQRDYLKRRFHDCDADLVVMEACGPSGWISDLAQSQGLKTLVCSTNEEACQWANVKRKTLDQRINKTRNTTRAWFVNHGIEIASGGKLAEQFKPDAEKFALGRSSRPSRHHDRAVDAIKNFSDTSP